jgi:hypothetical protein
MRTDGGRACSRISSEIAEGTVLMSVTSAAAGRAGRASTSSARMIRPPQERGTNSSKIDRSKQIEVENRTPSRSRGAKTSRAQWTKRRALRCSMATPLGRPVEPEV